MVAAQWLFDILVATCAILFGASILFARLATPPERRQPVRAVIGHFVYWARYFVPAGALVAAITYAASLR